jgi:predicted MFS family arabinose efflux permease
VGVAGVSSARIPRRDGTEVGLGVHGKAREPEKPASSGLLLAVLVSAVLVVITAGDMVVAVLPLVAEEFEASEAQLGWVLTGFLLVLSVGIPLYGRISDFFGLRRVFSAALVLFAAGSLVCALAPSLPVLVLGRIAQGTGAAAIPALSVVAVTRVMPPGERGGAVGLMASGGGVGIAAGPVLGGAVGQIWGWSGLFWVTTVLALVLIPGVLYALPDGAPRDGSEVSHHTARGFAGEGRFDLPGGALLGLGVGLFLFGITQGQVAGFASFSSWGSLLGAALAASLLVWRTVSAAHPFVPPSLFENRGYVAAVVVAFFAMFANVSALVLVPLLVVAANGLSTGAAGLVLTPGGVAVAILSPVAGRLSDRVGANVPVVTGLVVMGLSTLFLSTFAAGASPLLVSMGILGMGAGFAFTNSPANNAAAGALAGEQVGVGLGIFHGALFLGAGTGPTVIGAVLSARKESAADALNPLYVLDAAPFSDAFLAMTVAVILAVVAALGLRSGRQDDAA